MENQIQFLLYNMPDEEGKVQVVVKDGTIWCTQKAMAQLFGVGVPAISKHLNNIFEESELQKEVVVSKMEITTQHGAIKDKTQKSKVDFYSLDAIISVGYRVNSIRATKFRQWATLVLKEYITKGFVLDDNRLKQGTAVFGKNYHRLRKYKAKASELLTSEEGLKHRGRRCIEPEAVFGQMKHGMAYKRFRHFGKDKVSMDFAFFAIAFNIKKMCSKIAKHAKNGGNTPHHGLFLLILRILPSENQIFWKNSQKSVA